MSDSRKMRLAGSVAGMAEMRIDMAHDTDQKSLL
jgi:hypothetical protein